MRTINPKHAGPDASIVLRHRTPARRIAALLLAASLAGGCIGDEIVQPPVEQPVPGFLTIQLTGPPANADIGAMLVVEGPSIGTIQAPGFEVIATEAPSSTRRQVIVSGGRLAGEILEFAVPDRGRWREYQVRLLDVAGEGYVLRDPAAYRATISR